MPEVLLPRLSDSMEEGVIVAWLKTAGEEVTRGEPLAEIESDKATTIYEAPFEGVLRILKPEGENLPVGAVIAEIGQATEPDNGDLPSAPRAEPAEPAEPAGPAAQTAPPASPPPRAATSHRVRTTPLVRRLAREHGIELADVAGTGPQGRVTRADVEAELNRARTQSAPQPPTSQTPSAPIVAADTPAQATTGDVEVITLTGLQQTVSRRMVESKTTIPEFVLQREVDMMEAASLREGLAAACGPAHPVPSVNDLVIKACALALRAHPNVNASFRDGRVERYSRVNVGFAVAAPDALVVPVVGDADRLSIGAIAGITRAVSQRVRERQITPAELSGATFTVSNLGMFKVGWFIPVINPPQVAILGVGAMQERPVVHEGAVAARKRMILTLVSDHRVIYGADAAQFLADICDHLERPLGLML